MLDSDYPRLLARLIAKTTWSITLPAGQENFFEETGLATSATIDLRRSGRVRLRTRALAVPDETLACLTRPKEVIGIYTMDFSRHGFGFVSERQFFPNERLRILLPSFWLTVKVVRARYMGPGFFEHGTTLVRRSDPSINAFQGISLNSSQTTAALSIPAEQGTALDTLSNTTTIK